MRWNLLAIGGGLLVLTGMVLWFLSRMDSMSEPAWLLVGTVVGGVLGYAMAVVQALTAPSDPAPTITEDTALRFANKQPRQ